MAPFSPSTAQSLGWNRLERQVVSAPRRADRVIDTSLLTADLKHMLTGRLALDGPGLRVLVAYYAYRHGVLRMPI